MTTVGYGDIYPHTDLGRIVALAVMLVGIGFIAIITAALAQRFVRTELQEEVTRLEEEVSLEVGEAEAALLAELREITSRLHAIERRLADRRGA